MPVVRSCNAAKAQDQATGFKRSDRNASSEVLTLQKHLRRDVQPRDSWACFVLIFTVCNTSCFLASLYPDGKLSSFQLALPETMIFGLWLNE